MRSEILSLLCCIYIYIYIYIYIFFLGGGGRVGSEECGNSSPVPNLYLRSIIINSPLNFLKKCIMVVYDYFPLFVLFHSSETFVQLTMSSSCK